MKKLLKNRTTLGIACIVLSLLICFGLTPLFNSAVAGKTEIVRVTSNIEIGDEITSQMVQVVEVGGYNLPNDVIKSEDTVIGMYATSEMLKDDYILPDKISDEPLAEYGYLEGFAGDKRAISVSVRTFASGLSGKLERGDIVSVYVADYGDQKETMSLDELKYVEVLAVTLGSGYDNTQTEIIDGEEKELPSTVTLKVNEEQAIKLTDLENNGKIHIAFVYRGNADNTEAFLVMQEEISKQLEGEGVQIDDTELLDIEEQEVEVNELE